MWDIGSGPRPHAQGACLMAREAPHLLLSPYEILDLRPLNDAHFRNMHRSTIQRILAEAELKPHKVRSWMHSDDPEFEKKALDICGLYLAAPALFKKGELVLSTDEKTGIQALERKYPDEPA